MARKGSIFEFGVIDLQGRITGGKNREETVLFVSCGEE